MGITYIEGTVRGQNELEEPVRFLVDSGATYSLLPKYVWESIGLVPKREETFSLADGTTIQRHVSECYTPVILGEPCDEALLGVVTLEILALVFNPFNRTLQPMRMLLA